MGFSNKGMRMKLVIDIQGALGDSKHRGIGRHSLSLSLAIAQLAKQHEVWIILNSLLPESLEDIKKAFLPWVSVDRMRHFVTPSPTANVSIKETWKMQAAELLREQFLLTLQPDVVLITSLFDGFGDQAVASVKQLSPSPLVAVVLYDLIPFVYQDDYLQNQRYKRFYLHKLEQLKKADLLLSISEYSKKEAVELLAYPAEQVAIAPCAVDNCFHPQTISPEQKAQLFYRYGITKKIVMCAPGGFDSRKNLLRLMQAFALLPPSIRSQHQLVIASRLSRVATDDSRKQLHAWRKEAGLLEDELVLTDYLPQDDLVALYACSQLFVCPSLHEGFGLPPLEAMACGTAALGSNVSSIPEVVAFERALFDPYSVADMSQKMADALSDEVFLIQLQQHALRQAASFSWDSSAQKAWLALEHLFESSASRIQTIQNLDASFALQNCLSQLALLAKQHNLKQTDLMALSENLAFHQNASEPRQLLVDITQLVIVDAKTGIQRVVRSILWQLLKTDIKQKVRPVYFDGSEMRYADAFLKRFVAEQDLVQAMASSQYELEQLNDEIVQIHQYDTYLALDLTPDLSSDQYRILANWKAMGVKIHFVVYDLLAIAHPTWWNVGTDQMFHQWMTKISAISDQLICISKAVMQDVQDWLKAHPGKGRVPVATRYFHLGADLASSQPSKGLPSHASQVLQQMKQATSFLSVGTLEPRKGYLQTLQAFEYLWAQGVDVNWILVGKFGWKASELTSAIQKHPMFKQKLFWESMVSDEYLECLYEQADCLIAASEGEGFGLPLIEAGQKGLPILARDLTVFKEVATDFASYFHGYSGQELAQAIEDWMALNQQQKAPQSLNMPFLSWQQSTEQLLQLLD